MDLLLNKKILIIYISLALIIGLSMNGLALETDTYYKLTLDEAIKLAVKKNPQIKIAREELIEAKAELKESKADKLPSLNFSSSYTKQDEADRNLLSKDIYQIGLEGSYPLYTDHKITNNITNSQREIQKAKLGLEETKGEINFKVTKAYYDLLKDKEIVNLIEESLAQVEVQLKLANDHYQAGTALETDVLEAQVRKAEVKEDLIDAQNRVELARSQLQNIIGLTQTTQISIKSEMKSNDYDFSLDECTEKAYLNRAVLQQNKLGLTQAKTKIEIAEAADGPELFLNGNYNLRDRDFLPENESWKASIVLNIPLYDGGSSKAEVEKAESNLEQLKSRRWQLKESISLEVKEAYLDTRSAQERIEVACNSIEQAKKNLEIKESRYKEGVTTSTEVIDAEVALTTAKTNHLEAKYDYQIAAAKLIRAMGFKRGEWNEEI